MPEEFQRMDAIRVSRICDRPYCSGEMKPEGTVLMSAPPQYVHICDTCGDRVNFRTRYPYIDFQPSQDT